jgi:hypothetical protein
MTPAQHRALAIALRQSADLMETAASQCRVAAELNEQAAQELLTDKIIPMFQFLERHNHV